MTMRKEHASAGWERGQIARATHFVAYLFNGRFDKHRAEAPTLDAARAAGDRLNREHATNTRRALIYAITPEKWSIQVPDEYRP